MAIKQVVAMNALQETAAEVIKASVCAVDGGWLALPDGSHPQRSIPASEILLFQT